MGISSPSGTKFGCNKLETLHYQTEKPRVSTSPELEPVPCRDRQMDRITTASMHEALHWAATSIRHCSACSQPPSVILWTSPSRRPLAGSSPSSSGLHYGLSWWLETEGRSPQTIQAQNRGGWPAANKSRTSDSKAMRPGQIGMAATCGNGYVFDKLPKKYALLHVKT